MDKVIKTKTESGVISSLLYNNLLLLGLNNGSFGVFDLKTNKLLYSFGCMKQGSIVKISTNNKGNSILVIGDDPISILFKLN